VVYIPLHQKLPELASTETRSVTVFDDPILRGDQYVFIELYCDAPGCDCRRVMLNVVSRNRQKSVAVIAYGWESAEYYEKWFTKTYLLQDPEYLERLKRHYWIFKEKVDPKNISSTGTIRSSTKVLSGKKRTRRGRR
jgi:hypothetical protein